MGKRDQSTKPCQAMTMSGENLENFSDLIREHACPLNPAVANAYHNGSSTHRRCCLGSTYNPKRGGDDIITLLPGITL